MQLCVQISFGVRSYLNFDTSKLIVSTDSAALRVGLLELEIGTATTAHALPNPWRVKAQGLVMRHVPVNLYADDTSGNLSKRWNKHISFYCTLEGLPQLCLNMQYNCHFLSTSNQASVLELAEPIVEEFK